MYTLVMIILALASLVGAWGLLQESMQGAQSGRRR
jgi:hypothetical protein